MPLKLRKSFKFAPLLKLNLSKTGASLSLGKKGASINIGQKGIKSSLGLNGSGIGYSEYQSYKKIKAANQNANPDAVTISKKFLVVTIIVIAALAVASGYIKF